MKLRLRQRLRALIYGPTKRVTNDKGIFWPAYGDGHHDDTHAIQSMLDRGGSVNLPPGHYAVTGFNVVGGRGLAIYGAGSVTTTLSGSLAGRR